MYSPDQLKPTPHRKAFQIAGVITMLALIAMIWGNQHGHVEDIFLVVIAVLIGLGISGEAVLRRKGLKR